MGALRSALRLRTGLRARPEEADRVQAPCRVVNAGRIMRGTQRRRQQHSTGWGHPVDSCPTPDRGWVRAHSRMGKHIDGRHLGCVGTRLSSRSGAGSGPGAGGRSRKRSPSQAGSRARRGYPREPRELHAGTVGMPLNICRKAGDHGCPVSLAQACSPGELDMGTRQSRVYSAALVSPSRVAASFTTAGVRADRVGAKLSLRAIATGGAGIRESGPAPDP
jgi:hypothetical protein